LSVADLSKLGTIGTGFIVARSDWEYFFNTCGRYMCTTSRVHGGSAHTACMRVCVRARVWYRFVFEMAVGYSFIESQTGSCNGNFLGIGADACQNASVRVESADASGILIVNGEFTSFRHPQIQGVGADTQVVVTGSNRGAVRFTSSAFCE
jgi:hypothetical protein